VAVRIHSCLKEPRPASEAKRYIDAEGQHQHNTDAEQNLRSLPLKSLDAIDYAKSVLALARIRKASAEYS
jgi:hypothetical protein